MPHQQELILIPSERMDSNKKEGRNEHGLVRMAKAVRDFMGFKDTVELHPKTDNTQQRLSSAVILEIHQAFAQDLREARKTLSEAEMNRVGFVTTRVYNKVTSSRAAGNSVWITEGVTHTVIGADPEFLLFNGSNEVVRANNVLSHTGLIGSDGAMAEVRPHPAISPEELVAHIREIFRNKGLVKPIESYRWKACCYHKDNARDYPVGGHIHIGNPVRVARMSSADKNYFFCSFNKILDQLLAVPMTRIDGQSLGKARRTECTMGKYGYFGGFRTCDGRLEHRTLSGMWLIHPELAALVFGTAKAIIDEVYKHADSHKFSMSYLYADSLKNRSIWAASFDEWNNVPLIRDMDCGMSSSEMISILHNSDVKKVSPAFLKQWYSKMRNLSTYKTYAKYVDGLYEVLKFDPSAFHDKKHTLQRSWIEGRAFLK